MAVKPILVFYVDARSTDTRMEVLQRMQELSNYVEHQRVSKDDFDFFVFPRPQEDLYDVTILNPVPVTEPAYQRLKNWTETLIKRATEYDEAEKNR